MAKKEKNENLNKDNLTENENPTLNVDALTFEEAKQTLKEVLSANEETIKELETVKSELEAKTQEALDNKDKWYRAVAEFENYKKRNAETRKNAYFDGKKDSILSMLVIGDSIERALAVDMDEKTREGVNLIARQFSDTLKAFGVVEINPVGETFDPETCEAIHSVPCEEGETPNVVKTVFKKGYKLEDKIIRYCQVVVTID